MAEPAVPGVSARLLPFLGVLATLAATVIGGRVVAGGWFAFAVLFVVPLVALATYAVGLLVAGDLILEKKEEGARGG